MPKITIDLDNKQYKKLREFISDVGKQDLSHETFSGTSLEIGMSPFGHFLTVKQYEALDLGEVHVSFEEE